MNAPNILIVGAGIAGLATWRALQQQGIKAQIIEKHADWAYVGAGICLPANTVAAFERLGLRKPLLELAHQVTQIEYALADGTSLARASLQEAPLDRQPFVALTRRDLIMLMAQGIDCVRFSTTIQSLQQDSKGINLTLNDGKQERYDLVIAADGFHSATRALAFPRARIDEFGMTSWRFVIERDTRNLQPVYYLDKDDAFMLYPIGKNSVYCYAHLADPDSALYSQSAKAVLRKYFAHYLNSVTEAIAAIDDDHAVTVGRVECVVTDEANNGRVLLIGDALHGCPPTLQQGAGQALEDALTLARLLRTRSIDDGLRLFKQERMPQIRWVINQSNSIMKLGKLGKYWLGRALRNKKVRKQGPANVVGWRALLNEQYR